MPLSSIFQDHSFKRLVQGAAVGAVVTMIIGFNWGAGVAGRLKAQLQSGPMKLQRVP